MHAQIIGCPPNQRNSTQHSGLTPTEALWQTIGHALDQWQPGRDPPPLPPKSQTVVTALGGWDAISARRPPWHAVIAACNGAAQMEAHS